MIMKLMNYKTNGFMVGFNQLNTVANSLRHLVMALALRFSVIYYRYKMHLVNETLKVRN